MANDVNSKKHTSVREYIVVAAILAVITYIEFAIVEYDYAWLSSSAVLWILMILSVVKFAMVVLFFMHLKDDDVAYSGFFGTGMLMALGTFVAFAFLMTAPASINYFRANVPPGATGATDHAEHEGGVDDATRALIESDGYSRGQADVMDAGRPKDQSLRVEPPAAPEGDYSLAQAPAGAAPAAEGAGDGDAAAAGDGDGEAAPAGGDGGDAQAADGWDEALGEQVFGANCASCHQPGGQGIPGAFPPLAGHAATVASVEGGRTYLIDAVLFGLQGPIEVEGSAYNGVMPAWSQLSDEQVAAVVNHIVHFEGGEDVEPVGVDEVAAQRGEGLSAQDVHARREALALP